MSTSIDTLNITINANNTIENDIIEHSCLSNTGSPMILDYAVSHSSLYSNRSYSVLTHYGFPNTCFFALFEPHGADGRQIARFCAGRLYHILYNTLAESVPDSHFHTPYAFQGYEQEKVKSMATVLNLCFTMLQDDVFRCHKINSDYSGVSLCLVCIFGRHVYVANTGDCMSVVSRMRLRSVMYEINALLPDGPDDSSYVKIKEDDKKYTLQKPYDPIRYIRRCSKRILTSQLSSQEPVTSLEKAQRTRVLTPLFLAQEQTLNHALEYERIQKAGCDIHYPSNTTILKSFSSSYRKMTKEYEMKVEKMGILEQRPLLVDRKNRSDRHCTCLFPCVSRSIGDLHATTLGIIADPIISYHYLQPEDKNIIIATQAFWKVISGLKAVQLAGEWHDNSRQAACDMVHYANNEWKKLSNELQVKIEPSFSVINIAIRFI
jgi:serine/threonine protein phosphatase PrpC